MAHRAGGDLVLRHPLSYRDLEEIFRERGFEVDHSTINQWVLAYAPMVEKLLRQFRRPRCGSVRIDETYVKIRGNWRYLYGAMRSTEARSTSLTAKRDLNTAKRKKLKDEPLLSPEMIGTDGANTFPVNDQNSRRRWAFASQPSPLCHQACSKASRATVSGLRKTCPRSAVPSP